MIRPIRAKVSKRRSRHKKLSKSNKKAKHRGGAVYSFDLNEKIGGLPARITLNGTQDGDCPKSDVFDLGFSNYGLIKGGSKKKQNSKKSKKSKKSNKTKKTRKSKLRK
jgi:hypothetical protein